MAVLYTIASIEVLHRPTGERRVIRAASANLREITGLGGQVWEPCMTSPPQLNMRLFNGDFKAEVEPGNAVIPLNMQTLKKSYPWADQCHWKDARVSIWAGQLGFDWPWEKVFAGKVRNWDRRGQVITLTADVAFDDKNVLTKTYAGSGDEEGGADVKGRVKPLCIGWCLNVEPVLINTVDSVYQFSAYGPIEAVTTLFERGSSFGAPVGDYANYAALVAATIPAGGWGTCLALGLVRLGAPAAGVITADIKGHRVGSVTPRLTGAIVRELASIAGVSADVLNDESLALLDASVPYPVNLVLQQQETFLDLAQRLILPCNAQSGVSLTGKFFALPIAIEAQPFLELNAQGRRHPQVLASTERDTSNPYARTIMGAQRAWRVHSDEEIATVFTLEYRGQYDNAEIYREGQWVDMPDGSTWLYVNPTPTAGNAPPAPPATSNAYWERLNGPYSAENLTYADGTPIEDLKPTEPGADVTSAVTGIAEILIDADYTGAVTTALPRTQGYKLLRNGVDETTSATWSVTVVSGTISASIGATTGVLSLNASSGTLTSAVIQITAVLGDTERVMEVKVTKVLAPAPNTGGGGGTSASGSLSGTINSATMTGIGDELTVVAGSGGTVTLSASYSFTTTSGGGSFNLYGQWYMDVSGSYVAQGSEQISDNPYVPTDYTPGNGSINYTKTGLTPGNTYKFRCYMRTPSGTVARTVSGTNSAVGG